VLLCQPPANAVSGAVLGHQEGKHMPAHLKRLNFHGNGYCQGMLPHSLFLTSQYALLVAAHCCDCGGEFQVEIPIEQLIAACPGVPRATRASALITADDVAFLRDLHINPNLETSDMQNGDRQQTFPLK
jgi:hypothetical protein